MEFVRICLNMPLARCVFYRNPRRRHPYDVYRVWHKDRLERRYEKDVNGQRQLHRSTVFNMTVSELLAVYEVRQNRQLANNRNNVKSK